MKQFWITTRTILIVLSIPLLLTGLSVWAVPILWVQGSSAAFEFAGFLVILCIALWSGVWYLLNAWHQEKKRNNK